MNRTLPVWRSLLYVPANNPVFVAKAHTRDADGIILDLEDSVPPAERPGARRGLAQAAQSVRRRGADVLVRVNSTDDAWPLDFDAAVVPGVDALMLTKVESAREIQQRVERIVKLEASRGLAPGSVSLFVLAETPAAMFKLEEIARADERIVAMGLGSEDFAAAVCSQPGPDTLALPKQLVLYAARAAGISPMGLMGTVADYKDLDAVRLAATTARRFGFDGASCIHPSNVPVLNAAFSPTKEAVDDAERIVAAYKQALARGTGAITVAETMIDVPVAERAQNVLRRAAAITARESRTREAK